MRNDERQIEEIAEKTRKLLIAFINWAGGIIDFALTLSSKMEDMKSLKKLHSTLREIKNDFEFFTKDTSYEEMKRDIIGSLISTIEQEMRIRKIKGERRKGYMDVISILRHQIKEGKRVKKVKLED